MLLEESRTRTSTFFSRAPSWKLQACTATIFRQLLKFFYSWGVRIEGGRVKVRRETLGTMVLRELDYQTCHVTSERKLAPKRNTNSYSRIDSFNCERGRG